MKKIPNKIQKLYVAFLKKHIWVLSHPSLLRGNHGSVDMSAYAVVAGIEICWHNVI